MALVYGVDPVLADYVISHESQYDCTKVGDLTPMKDGVPAHARGCWQITRKFHSEVSDACAFDIVCSTKWALPILLDKNACVSQFSTCRDYYK